MITNDAVVLGILLVMLALIFWTSSSKNPLLKRFYKVVPMLLLCYFLPSLLNTFGIVDGESSNLYYMASRFLLPASLVLLTLSIDLKEILKLGPKALIMFVAATIGIVIGGPLAILTVNFLAPGIIENAGPDLWRGMATVAGSWIGGGANQAAMYEVFEVPDQLFAVMITVDVIVAQVWMAVIILGIGQSDRIDRKLKADNSAIITLQEKMETFRMGIARIPTLSDLMVILAIGFGFTAIGHFLADTIAPYIGDNFPTLSKLSLDSTFFWLVVVATTLGLLASFTRLRNMEGAGASRVGSVFIYILVATIGMQMNVMDVFDHPGLFLIGAVWMLVHVIVLLLVAWIIKAPFFFVAVGSQANVGGAASAPIIASAFHPSLAPVGVLMAVLGYALGTYCAWFCAIMMQGVMP